MSELPKGWSIATFDDVIYSITNGLNGKQNKDGNGIPVSRIESIASQVVDMSRIGYLNEYDDETLEKYRLQQGDVLFSHINSPAHIGKTAICEDGIALYHGVNLLRIVLNGTIEPQLFNYYCKFIRARGDFSSNAQHAVNQSSLNQKKIKLFEIVLPAKQEQTRIANKLDSILAKVDKAQARLNKIPAILKRFRQSVLAAATSGELTQSGFTSSEWQSVKLIDLVENKPRNGKSPKGVDFDTGVKNLTLSAITPGYFVENKYKFVDLDVPTDSHLWLKNQDILIQRANSIEYVGVSALYEGEDDQYIYPDLIMKCRANARVLSKYLYYALSSEPVRKYFRDNATGTTGNMPKINQTVVSAAPINLPQIDEQKIIVNKVGRLFKKADKLEQQYLDAKARLDRLTQSILAKAFRGELVPQDPNDEPAEQLLERILKERLSQQQKADKPKKIAKKRTTKAKITDKG
ncbi:restriction endonuclease subunit S [Photobacterium piscicola]|uniref:restriction endonuclease subunit S n=1 Tax=Photobacterium piscicola TaxID=1378299 RepID=UPI002E16CB38|nr:restriction endonuclease subunit S [Photobacterium piscicola]